jgi:alkylation response protein AidB-like acyl-CoA dehydrogenase
MTHSLFQFQPAELPASALQLRREVRSFLREEIASGAWRPAGDFCSHFSAEFSQRIGARGWIGLTWPRAYGGHERSTLERYVVTEEMLVAGAPVTAHWIADRQSGPLLLRFGTEEQRQKYLPGIARGESYFAIGMSEPDAGSDLAAVRTRAEKVPGGWMLNGRKVWTTYAHRCHYAVTLARTGPAGESRHEGLTQFIVDLHAKGITISPIINLAGTHEFNEVLFEDVFLADDTLVGRPGSGWHQVTSELAFERSGPERFLSSFRLFQAMVGAAGETPDPRVAEAIGRLAAHLMTLRQMSLSVAAMLGQGAMPNFEAALIKDLGNACEREIPELARLLGPALPGRYGPLDAILDECILYAPSWTLRGGTREILRGIIARGLGLR